MTRQTVSVSQVRILVVALALIFLLAIPAAAQPTAGPPDPKVDPGTWAKVEPQVLKELAQQGLTTFIVYLREQADLRPFLEAEKYGGELARQKGTSPMPEQAYRDQARATKLQQRQATVGVLQATATRSQAGVRAFLDVQRARGAVQDYTPFWIFNGLAVTGDEATLVALAARSDVDKIRANHVRQLSPVGFTEQSTSGPVVSWNVDKIRARDAWQELGIDGQGVVVANMDSGVDWEHPALRAHYRGADGTHDYNWFDVTGQYATAPGDGDGHGTHTMGTIAGGSADDVIGIAPGAHWIAVKILTDQGTGTDDDIHAGFQWLLAPTDLNGQNPDPSKAPDIVNNSWGGGPLTDFTFMPDVEALRAAGIIPVFSSGNEGELGAASVGFPGTYPNVISVGATDANDVIGSFSGRGPSFWDEIKPEVSAPGVSVRSSLPGAEYGNGTGTSMAAPHVTGLVALMLQADPGLSFDDVESFLKLTATDLGTSGPDNDYGWGRIDAYEAVRWVQTAGRLHGRVTAGDGPASGQPLAGATVTGVHREIGERFTAQADADGVYHVAVPAGLYDVAVSAFGYGPASVSGVEVVAGFLTLTDFALKPAATGIVAGHVADAATGQPLAAEIAVMDTPVEANTDASGRFRLSLPPGTYLVRASAPRHRAQTLEVEISAPGAEASLAFELPGAASILFVDADVWLGANMTPVFRQALDELGYPYTVRPIANTDDVPTAGELGEYSIVIWNHLWSSPGWINVKQRGDTAVTDALSNYLGGGGGRLLIMGQDIGYWDSTEGDSRNRLAPEFYRQVLHGIYEKDAAGKALTGVAGDVFDGSILALGGVHAYRRGAELAGDGIRPADTEAGAVIAYDGSTSSGGLRFSTSTSRLIYLAFGLEDAEPRDQVLYILGESLSWLSRPSFSKTVDRVEAAPGTILTYQLALDNPSSIDLPGWTLTDPLPAEVAYVPGSLSCAGVTCGAPAYDPAARAIRWSGSLLASGALTFTFQAAISSPILGGTGITNTATLDDGHGQSLTASTGTTVQGPDLSASTKQAGPAVVAPGDLVTYTVTLRNQALTDAPGTRLIDPIPAGTTYVTGSATGGAGYNPDARQVEWTGTVPAGGMPSGAYTWTDSDRPGGPAFGWVDITETGTAITGVADDTNVGPFDIGFGFPFYGRIFNTFRVASNGFLSLSSTSTAYNNQRLPSGAEPLNAFAVWWDDLIFTSSARALYWTNGSDTLVVSYLDVPRLTSGGPYTFQVILKADGTVTYQYLSMQGTRLGEATIGIQNGDGTAGVTVAHNEAYVHDGLAVRFSPPGTGAAPVTLTFQVRVNPDVPANTRIANTATVTDGAGYGYSLSASSLVQPADLSTSVKTVEPAVVEAGQAVRYTVSVRNTSSTDAQRVTVDDDLPAEVTFVPGSASQGATYDPATHRLTWTGSVAAGGQQAVSFQAAVKPAIAAGTVFTNTAVIGDGLRAPLRRSAVAVVQVVDLSGSVKLVDRAVANSGDELTYQVAVANRGLITATGVSLVDPLPPGTSYLSGSATGGATYNEAQNRIEWQGSLPPYTGYRFTDSTRPGGPVFSWIDIAGIGTLVSGLSDDSNHGPFDIGFDFPFYGQVFRQFYLNSNGFLSFSPIVGPNYSNYTLPTPLAPDNLVAMFWDDLTFAAQGKAYIWANGRDTLVVSFVGVPRLVSGGPYTFQAVLRADGTVTLQYLDMRGTRLNEATVGVQNADGSEGLTVASNQAYIRDNLAVLVRPPAVTEIGFRVRLDGDLPLETTITNTASLDDGRGTVIQRSAATWVNTLDLSQSTLAVDRATAGPGDTLTYRADLRNAGSTAANAQASVLLPGHTAYVAGSATGGATYDAAGGRIEWNGSVPPASSPGEGAGTREFTFAVRLDSPLANATLVEAVATVADGVHPTFTCSALTRVQAPNLAGSTKSVDRAVANVGDTLNYTLLVENSGDAPAQAIITDTLPNSVAYVDGSGQAAAGSPPAYDPATRQVTWRGTLPSHSRMLLVLAAQVTGLGPIVNWAAFDDGAGTVIERTAETRPLEVEVAIAANRADTGYITSEDRTGSRFGVREIYAGVDTRPQTPVTLNGVFQFNLSELPPGARIVDAQVELAGLDGRFLEPAAHGQWRLVLLDSSVDLSWTRLGYWQIHNARAEATSSPALTDADLAVGVTNRFGLSGGLAALEARLATTQRASFRLEGAADRPGVRQIFGWDATAPPILRLKYTLP